MSACKGYTHESILLNGRQLKLASLANEKPRTPFEAETLLFIAAWLKGQRRFAQRTSGSTGKPKTIMLTRRQLAQSARRTLSALPVKPGDTALLCLDPRYIAGKMMLVRAFIHNLPIVAVEPSGNPLAHLEQPVDFTAVVPLQLSRILAESPTALQKIKTVLVGGAPVPPPLAKAIQPLPGAVYATYGMTETASNIALQRLSGANPDRSFRPLPGVTLTLNHRGCLVIRLPDFAKPIVTRDAAEIFPDGTFQILGRLDHVINSGGHKNFSGRSRGTYSRGVFSFAHKPFFFCKWCAPPPVG
ncbi:MAG: hypothetical protein KatS3mg032_0580 [Cyclobacteriaceae bacterium]|nr:MAG: hypothetical protein KatS3mg032_0580 [Cyclobacteriaceae bacterium]